MSGYPVQDSAAQHVLHHHPLHQAEDPTHRGDPALRAAAEWPKVQTQRSRLARAASLQRARRGAEALDFRRAHPHVHRTPGGRAAARRPLSAYGGHPGADTGRAAASSQGLGPGLGATPQRPRAHVWAGAPGGTGGTPPEGREFQPLQSRLGSCGGTNRTEGGGSCTQPQAGEETLGRGLGWGPRGGGWTRAGVGSGPGPRDPRGEVRDPEVSGIRGQGPRGWGGPGGRRSTAARGRGEGCLTEIDVSEGAATDLPAQPVPVSDSELHGGDGSGSGSLLPSQPLPGSELGEAAPLLPLRRVGLPAPPPSRPRFHHRFPAAPLLPAPQYGADGTV